MLYAIKSNVPSHLRAWVAVDQCFQISENNCKAKAKGPRSKFDVAIKELNEHIRKIEAKYSTSFPYAAAREPLDPKKIYISIGDDQSEPGEEDEDEPIPEEDEIEDGPLVINAGDDKKSITSPADSQDHSVSKQPSANGEDSADEKTLTIDEKDAGIKGVFTFTNDSAMDEFKPDLVKGDKVPSPVKSVKGKDAVGEVNQKSKSTPKDRKTPLANKKSRVSSIKPTLKADVVSPAAPNSHIFSPVTTPVAGTSDDLNLQVLKLEVERLKKDLDDEKKQHGDALKVAQDQTNLEISSLRAEFAKEKEHALNEFRQHLESKHQVDIEQIKKKQVNLRMYFWTIEL